MNDNEIIKALECCISLAGEVSCKDCPLYDEKNKPWEQTEGCSRVMGRKAIEIINRLQAENKELKEEKHILSQKRANIFEIISAFERGRTDGIIKFAERLKETANSRMYRKDVVYIVEIDNLVKELEGKDK